ncbi:MAG: hypothetical protein ACO1OF_03140 [Adhaeribacter sp.]
MEINLFGLIKFGQKVHVEELYKKGTIYMNHLSEFLKIDDNGLRGDKYESLSEIKEIFNVEISHQGRKVGYAKTGRLSLWNNELSGNIYSMYTLYTLNNLAGIRIDAKCKDFGDAFVIITNVEEFIARIQKEADKLGLDIIYGPVDYVNTKEYLGNWSVFKKPIEYSFQNEFRFFIRQNSSGPFSLSIGTIEDISSMLDSQSLEELSFARR